jgi:serine/threonine protein kinase
MGVVYEAWQVNAERFVALKCILAGSLASAEEVERFKTEARAVAGLDHPNIVLIHDVGEHEGQPYFTMKLMPGGSLAEQVARGPMPSRHAAEVVAIVAHAIHHAHGKDILHRDLKPGNILLDGEGRPHVADFGLAKRLEAPPGITRRRGRSSARPATWPRSRPAATRRRSALVRTCTRWEPCCTHC